MSRWEYADAPPSNEEWQRREEQIDRATERGQDAEMREAHAASQDLPIHIVHPPTPTIPVPKRKAKPAKAKPAPPTDRAAQLAQQMRALLAQHTSGDIIESAWQISAEIFRERMAAQAAARAAHPA